jgi:aryl-alcohol dehydrogenase-like predicted oxidoreductase
VRQRSLGRTGIECSELGLGTWGLSGSACGPVKHEEQDRVIARARASGITLFETADIYADGAMEERLGRILGNDEHCCVVTKIGTSLRADPPRKCFDVEFLHQSFCATTARLHPRQSIF